MNWQQGVKYATGVSKGEINVCRDVRLACQRFINQYENQEWEYYFDPDYPAHVLEFAAELRHTKGPLAGQSLELEPFQILLICAIYGFRRKKDHRVRMVQDVILFIPRKAGKSTLTAVIGLYELQCGEAGPEVYTLATSREQATIVFDAAKGFHEAMSPDMASLFLPSKYDIKKAGDSQSKFMALSRDTKKTGDGKNPSCVIIDEAAQIVDRNSIEVLHSGMVARMNPLRIYITTASFTKETKFYEDMAMFQSMLHGEAPDNPRWFGLLYALDPQDDWQNPETWAKANPMHNISVFGESIASRAEESKHKPATLNEFLCKTLNIFVSANSAWIDKANWEKAKTEIGQREPEAVFIGFDLAATRDLNAVCTLSRFSDMDYEAKFKFFLPEDSIAHIPKHYMDIFRMAITSGALHLTQGNVMDDREISDYIQKEAAANPNLKEVGYDAYNAANIVARLHEAGLPVKKVGQGMAVLNNPSKQVERLILNCGIKHDGNPFVTWQLGNCEVYEDVNGNIKIRKNEADKSAKVDGIIAMIIAMHCALDNPMLSDSFGFRTF